MSMIDVNKRMQKWRTEEEIDTALSNFCQGKHTMTIPPQKSDDDIILYDAFSELLKARKTLDVFNTTPFANLTKEQKMAIQEWCDFVSLVSSKDEAEEGIAP